MVNLPIPECKLIDSSGVEEPVKKKAFFLPFSYIKVVIEFQIEGTSCHSSKSIGFGKTNNSSGNIFARLLFFELLGASVKLIIVVANFLQISLFPQYFCPLITIVQEIRDILSISFEIILSMNIT
jgi:hypothetical protein